MSAYSFILACCLSQDESLTTHGHRSETKVMSCSDWRLKALGDSATSFTVDTIDRLAQVRMRAALKKGEATVSQDSQPSCLGSMK